MKFIVLLILLFTFSFSFSQTTWPPNSSIWYYETYSGWFPPIFHEYMTIEVNGDTVIKGKSCRILEKKYYSRFDGGCTDNDENEYVYNDSNKVYLYNRALDTFSILYDFGAKQYDTIKYTVDSCYYSLIIDSLSEIIINQDTLTVFHIGYSEIIEGIGSMGYLFPSNNSSHCGTIVCDGAGIVGLRCYSDSIIGHFETGLNDCEATVIWNSDKTEINKNSYINIYPNPTSSYLFIESELYKGEFLIYNSNGQLVHSSQLISGINRIDLSKIENGLYLYKVSNELKSGKILIQR